LLRLVFVLTFFAQLVVAAIVGVIVRAFAANPPLASPVLATVLVAAAVLQLPIALAAAFRLGKVVSRQAALSRTLFMGVLLSATAWFTSLALATGQRGASVYLLLALVMLAYALGFLAVSRLAKTASSLPAARPPSPSGG